MVRRLRQRTGNERRHTVFKLVKRWNHLADKHKKLKPRTMTRIWWFYFQICVNDDLVTKKFALYDSQSADGAWLDECPVMLSTSILTQMACRTPKKPTAQAQAPPGKQAGVLYSVSTCSRLDMLGCTQTLWLYSFEVLVLGNRTISPSGSIS